MTGEHPVPEPVEPEPEPYERPAVIYRMEVLRGTFRPDWINPFGLEVGTVEVQYGGYSHRVQACVLRGGELQLRGFVGRYRTGKKLWPARVVTRGQGLDISFGRRVVRGNTYERETVISYEPNTEGGRGDAHFWSRGVRSCLSSS